MEPTGRANTTINIDVYITAFNYQFNSMVNALSMHKAFTGSITC